MFLIIYGRQRENEKGGAPEYYNKIIDSGYYNECP